MLVILYHTFTFRTFVTTDHRDKDFKHGDGHDGHAAGRVEAGHPGQGPGDGAGPVRKSHKSKVMVA